MPVIRRADARRTTTPNATMTTLASPTQGETGLAVWRVDMAPGVSGPEHTFDVEQIWTVLDGRAEVELAGVRHAVAVGDTVAMPAEAVRRVHADPHAGFVALVAAPGGARARVPGGEPVLPPWIA